MKQLTRTPAALAALASLLFNYSAFSAASAPNRPTPQPEPVFAGGAICDSILQSQKTLEDFPFLKIANFNIENLFIAGHMPANAPADTSGRRENKPVKALIGVANVILRQLPHIVVLEEVDRDGTSLQFFVEHYLRGIYDFKIAPSPDGRGIANAFLVRKDLPVETAIISHGTEQWQDPTQGNRTEPLFQRDLPLLAIYPKGEVDLEKAPLLGIFGVHFKSKRERSGDPESRMLRRAEATRAAEIFRRYLAKWGENTPLMISGDFNGVVGTEDEFTEFRANIPADNVRAALLAGEEGSLLRGTHMYLPRGGKFEVNELDYQVLNRAITKYAIGLVTDRYKVSRADLSYKILRQNIRNYPSDHFSISVLLSLPEILANYRAR